MYSDLMKRLKIPPSKLFWTSQSIWANQFCQQLYSIMCPNTALQVTFLHWNNIACLLKYWSTSIQCNTILHQCLGVVSSLALHRSDLGSIPGFGIQAVRILIFQFLLYAQSGHWVKCLCKSNIVLLDSLLITDWGPAYLKDSVTSESFIVFQLSVLSLILFKDSFRKLKCRLSPQKLLHLQPPNFTHR